MDNYFFDLHECGRVTTDPLGLELPGPDAARAVAIDAARDIIAGEARRGMVHLDCCIEVRDAARQVILVLPFRDAVIISGIRDGSCTAP